MKKVWALTTITLNLFITQAFALNARDYLACFKSLSRDKVTFNGLYLDSPVKALLLANAQGNKRGFYFVEEESQALKWVTDFRAEAPGITNPRPQYFSLNLGAQLPEVTMQTSYMIHGSQMKREDPTISFWLSKNSSSSESVAKLETEAISDSTVRKVMNTQIAATISNLANSYFPNTSHLSKLLRDTLEIAKAIQSTPADKSEVYITYSNRDGGRNIPRQQALNMLEALKKKSIEMGEDYYNLRLNEPGMNGFNEMIQTCGALNVLEIENAITHEIRELSSFLSPDIEAVRALK